MAPAPPTNHLDQPPTTNHRQVKHERFATYLFYFHDSFNSLNFLTLWDDCQGAWDLLKNPEKRSAYDASTGT